MLNSPSLAKSVVGRDLNVLGTSNRLPLYFPEIMRISLFYLISKDYLYILMLHKLKNEESPDSGSSSFLVYNSFYDYSQLPESLFCGSLMSPTRKPYHSPSKSSSLSANKSARFLPFFLRSDLSPLIFLAFIPSR